MLDNVSKEIYNNVARRGYTHNRMGDSYSPTEFVARQAVKAAEEALEALALVSFDDAQVQRAMQAVVYQGRMILQKAFDRQLHCSCDIDKVLLELADLLVCGHSAFGSVGHNGDYEALKKSEGDIKRGVRGDFTTRDWRNSDCAGGSSV